MSEVSPFQVTIRRFGRKPYQWAGERIRREIKNISSDWEVWPRNSYLTSAFQPFKSDLDLTIWMKNPPSRQEQIQMRRVLRRAKKLFPFLGECNVYVEAFARRYVRWWNFFEGQRDPYSGSLLSAFERSEVISLPAQRSAFLLRMLDADKRNLKHFPRRRARKWRLHLQALNDSHLDEALFDSSRPFDSLLAASLYWLFDQNDPAHIYRAVREAKAFLERGHHSDEGPVPPIWAALFPHHFSSYQPPGPAELEVFMEVTKAQLAWELWGMQSQFLLRSNFPEVLGHLERLSRFCHEAGPAFQDFAQEFRSLGEQMKPIHFSEEDESSLHQERP